MSAPLVSSQGAGQLVLRGPDASGQLQDLKELPLPDAVSYAPQTIGWVAVALLLMVVLAVVVWLLWRRHRRQRYRRVALAELAHIEASLVAMQNVAADTGERARCLAEIPRLLKRTALAVAPRDEVAALSGAEWLDFLQRTHGRHGRHASNFDSTGGALLTLASYAPTQQVAAISAHDAATLIAQARDWIEHHHVEV
ncbi:hypothetical protein P3T18_004738 [Paraburkholderia sp. GAS199]|uniref:DUF4381 domain-containing protein n=1 Tax=Paraburkholderia sp. GAS199 TaxID=3035126 RepID=UPI003D1AEF46